MSDKWFKQNPTDKVYWLNNGDEAKGEFIFSFDKKEQFNLFADYPYKLTAEQKEIFDAENEYWYNYFIDRQKDYIK